MKQAGPGPIKQADNSRGAEVRDRGDLRDWRIEIPNLVDDLGLSVYAVRLYMHLKRVAGAKEDGRCKQSTRTLAHACRMSLGKVVQAKAELEKERLIPPATEPVKLISRTTKLVAGGELDVIEVADIWDLNFRYFSGRRGPKGVHEVNTSAERSPDERSVHLMNAQRSPDEHKKEPCEKEPIKKEHEGEAAVAARAPLPAAKSKVDADPRSKHPAIQAYRDVAERYPNKALWDDLIALLGESPDVDRLRSCYKKWIEQGFRPVSSAWATEWYSEGIPEKYDRKSRGGKNAESGDGSASSDARAYPESGIHEPGWFSEEYGAGAKRN